MDRGAQRSIMDNVRLGVLKLRFTAIGTLALVIGVSTLFFTFIMNYMGLGLFFILPIVIIFNVLQWLFAPKLINAMYRVKEVGPEHGVYTHVQRLSQKMGLKMPKPMLADIPIANAFAYGSPLTGSMVAVTSGLLKELEDEEVEAVIGHELGHLKNRDVRIMMFVSILPAIFYWIYVSMFWSGMFGGYRRNGRGGYTMIIAIAALAMYWVLSILTMGLSRIREYYADRRSVMVVEDGGRKLSEALAKIVSSSARMKMHKEKEALRFDAFRALFIEDPENSLKEEIALSRAKFSSDQKLVQEILGKETKLGDRIAEIFSTHPNIVKRLRALQAYPSSSS